MCWSKAPSPCSSWIILLAANWMSRRLPRWWAALPMAVKCPAAPSSAAKPLKCQACTRRVNMTWLALQWVQLKNQKSCLARMSNQAMLCWVLALMACIPMALAWFANALSAQRGSFLKHWMGSPSKMPSWHPPGCT